MHNIMHACQTIGKIYYQYILAVNIMPVKPYSLLSPNYP